MTDLTQSFGLRESQAPLGAQVHFDRGPLGGATEFTDPIDVIRADTADEVAAAFAAIEEARARGLWLAGMASYELGYALDPRLAPLMPGSRDIPLLHFGVFAAPQVPVARPVGVAGLSSMTPLWSLDRYREAFVRVREFIAAGDIYQANLTFPLQASWSGDAHALYERLMARQSVGHGAYLDLGGVVILSRSPELFFRTDANGRIETRPMKGTLPRGSTPEDDAQRREWLRNDVKNRAENLMIVDLLRNDISRVSHPGTVRVPELFGIESYATVHQMVSRVTADLLQPITVQALFAALFPCGSVTGAPKIRAMEIIRELEDAPRGAYCGAIGWIAPDGAMEFNVAIRTLVLRANGHATLNVGGGVVWDSTAEAEYEEALWKARFAQI